MYEVPCLDLNGNTINKFYQWDIDQKIVIELKGCDKNYLKIAPEIHYTNVTRKESLIVRSTVTNDDTITADIPNVLLQEPYPLLIYVYLTDSVDVSSQKTILYSEIPIRKRAKPSDYLYVENITRITAEMIKTEIEASTKETRTDAINDITATKDSAIATVNQTRDNAVNTITENKNSFIQTGNNLVNTATDIKNNAQRTYENAVNVANQTQTTIENNINTMMLDNGLTLETKNDGAGNVGISIVVNQS